MKLKNKEGKLRFYQLADGRYLQTGSYFNEDTGEEVFANKSKVDWIEFVEIDVAQIETFYQEQCSIKNGAFFVDVEWNERLMPPFLIRKNYLADLDAKIDAELEKPEPNPVEIAQLQRQKEKCKDWTDIQWYQQALINLDERVANGEADKPLIRQKLQEKIGG